MMKFDWDPDKARRNVEKHQVSFQEAATVFDDPLSSTFPDSQHSSGEARWVIIGQSQDGRVLFVAHADRGNLTRIISAREVTRREQRIYEESL
jgi:uncharacterized protein